MAIKLLDKENVDGEDSDYIYGKIKDDDGTGNGTPVDVKTYGDFHQFFARLMDKAGIVPNDLPDNNYSGFQLFDALKGDDPIVYDTYVKYWRAGGRVHLQGGMGSGLAAITSAGTDFILPGEFRPAVKQEFFLMWWDSGTVEGVGKLTINTNGVVNFSAFTGAGSARQSCITGVSYPIK